MLELFMWKVSLLVAPRLAAEYHFVGPANFCDFSFDTKKGKMMQWWVEFGLVQLCAGTYVNEHKIFLSV